MKNTLTSDDIDFVQSLLGEHYHITETYSPGNLHCTSRVGIRKPAYVNAKGRIIEDDEDDFQWTVIKNQLRRYFKDRFVEIDHFTCTLHMDFVIYLKAS